MRRHACVAVLCLFAGAAFAQTNGDVSGGLNHQPTGPEVRTRENSGGVAPPPAEQRREDRDVDEVYDKLTGHPRPGSADDNKKPQ